MKRVLLILFLTGSSFGMNAGGQTIIEYPSFKSLDKIDNYNSSFVVTSVRLDETETVINFDYTYAPKKKRKKHDLGIPRSSFLAYDLNGIREYVDIINSEGIPMSPESIIAQSSVSISFSLSFGPVPKGVESLNVLVNSNYGMIVSDIDLSQSNTSETQTIGTFNLDDVFVKPTFQGQPINAISNYVSKHLKYPQECKTNGNTGTVIFDLRINKDGRLDYEMIEGAHILLNAEAFRVVSELEGFTPASFFGRAINVHYKFPVIFQINKSRK